VPYNGVHTGNMLESYLKPSSCNILRAHFVFLFKENDGALKPMQSRWSFLKALTSSLNRSGVNLHNGSWVHPWKATLCPFSGIMLMISGNFSAISPTMKNVAFTLYSSRVLNMGGILSGVL